MSEILRLEHIQKFYGNRGNLTKAINDISFSVNKGKFVGIMGASGAGKTTLLNCNSRKAFFEKILDVLTMLGGGGSDVC